MQALHDVVQKGWVRYIGMSSCYAHQFWQMQSECIRSEDYGLAQIDYYSLRHLAEAYTVHQHAELRQCRISRGRTRNGAYSEALWCRIDTLESDR